METYFCVTEGRNFGTSTIGVTRDISKLAEAGQAYVKTVTNSGLSSHCVFRDLFY